MSRQSDSTINPTTDEKELRTTDEPVTVSPSPKELGEDDVTPANSADETFTWIKFLAVAAISIGYMSDVLVQFGTSTLLLPLNATLGPSNQYVWMANGSTVSSAALGPFVGRLSDIFGRRNFIMGGSLMGIIGLIVCITAKSVNSFIPGSALVGVSICCHQLSWSVVAEIVPRKSRAYSLGILTTLVGFPASFGPLIAYAFYNNGTWKGVFYLGLGMQCLSLVMTFIFYRPINQYIKEEGKSKLQQLAELDYVGGFLGISGLTLFLLGISFGGTAAPWASATTLVPLLLGVVLIVLCGFWEAYATLSYAMVPKEIVTNVRGVTVLIGATTLIGMCVYSTSVLWPQQVARLYSTDNIIIGLLAGASNYPSFFILFFSYFFTKTKSARWLFTFVVFLVMVFSGLQAIVTPGSVGASTAMAILLTAGCSGAVVGSTFMLQLGVKHEHLGVATSLLAAVRVAGGAIATAIYSSVLNNRLTSNLKSMVVRNLIAAGVPTADIPEIISALLQSHGSSPSLPSLSPAILEAAEYDVKRAFAKAFRVVYLVSITFGVLGTVSAAFSLDVNHLMTTDVDVQLGKGQVLKTSKKINDKLEESMDQKPDVGHVE